jgi:hypothetical protein
MRCSFAPALSCSFIITIRIWHKNTQWPVQCAEVAVLEKQLEGAGRRLDGERKRHDDLVRERDILTKLKSQARNLNTPAFYFACVCPIAKRLRHAAPTCRSLEWVLPHCECV